MDPADGLRQGRTSLEVILVPNLPWAKLKAGAHWCEGPDDPARTPHMIEKYGEDKFCRPVMDAGDVAVFAENIYLHLSGPPSLTHKALCRPRE